MIYWAFSRLEWLFHVRKVHIIRKGLEKEGTNKRRELEARVWRSQQECDRGRQKRERLKKSRKERRKAKRGEQDEECGKKVKYFSNSLSSKHIEPTNTWNPISLIECESKYSVYPILTNYILDLLDFHKCTIDKMRMVDIFCRPFSASRVL